MQKRNLFTISYFLEKFFLFICLLYGFIPFEAVAILRTDRLHLLFLIAILIYVLFITSFRINKYGGLFIIISISLALMNAFISLGHDIVLFAESILFAAIVVPALYSNERFREQFICALRWLIILSITMFILQFIVYHLSGSILRLHEMVFPFSQARIAEESSFGNLVRMGGIYIEPGTYSNYMYIYILIYSILTKKLSGFLSFATAITTILTFSVWGMIFASYFLFIIILDKLKQKSFIVKTVVLFIFLSGGVYISNKVLNDPAVEYAVHKLDSNRGSTGYKKQAYKKYELSYENFLFIGEGFIPEFKKGIPSLQDSGVLLNISIVFGIFFTAIFMLIFLLALSRLHNYLLAFATIPIFIDKIYYWDVAFVLLYFLVIYDGLIKNKKGNI